MHCLFLGIAKWIVVKLWIDGGKLGPDSLKLINEKAKQMQIPSNIRRIPFNIDSGKEFSRYTADQWRIFIMIYAMNICWDLLT
jgi:hypothetical protein